MRQSDITKGEHEPSSSSGSKRFKAETNEREKRPYDGDSSDEEAEPNFKKSKRDVVFVQHYLNPMMMRIKHNPNEVDMDDEFKHVEETKPQYLIIHIYAKGHAKTNPDQLTRYTKKICTLCNWHRPHEQPTRIES